MLLIQSPPDFSMHEKDEIVMEFIQWKTNFKNFIPFKDDSGATVEQTEKNNKIPGRQMTLSHSKEHPWQRTGYQTRHKISGKTDSWNHQKD